MPTSLKSPVMQSTVPKAAHEFILGIDFLTDKGCLWDFRAAHVQLGSDWVSLRKCSVSARTTVCCWQSGRNTRSSHQTKSVSWTGPMGDGAHGDSRWRHRGPHTLRWQCSVLLSCAYHQLVKPTVWPPWGSASWAHLFNHQQHHVQFRSRSPWMWSQGWHPLWALVWECTALMVLSMFNVLLII